MTSDDGIVKRSPCARSRMLLWHSHVSMKVNIAIRVLTARLYGTMSQLWRGQRCDKCAVMLLVDVWCGDWSHSIAVISGAFQSRHHRCSALHFGQL